MGPVCYWLTAEGQPGSASIPLLSFFSLPSSTFSLTLPPLLSLPLSCPLTPLFLFTTCLAHSSSARWNNTPSHTKTSSVDSLRGPPHPPEATVYGAYDQMWGCNTTVLFWNQTSFFFLFKKNKHLTSYNIWKEWVHKITIELGSIWTLHVT